MDDLCTVVIGDLSVSPFAVVPSFLSSFTLFSVNRSDRYPRLSFIWLVLSEREIPPLKYIIF